MKNKISVNIISETVKTVKGHGVHSAFIDMKESLKKRDDVDVYVNSNAKTDITHIHTSGPYSYMKALRANKCVISAHLVPDSLKGSLAFTRFWLPLYTKYLLSFYNKADALLANSPYTQEELEKLNLKAPLQFVSLGVNRDWFQYNENVRKELRRKHKIQEDAFVVIAVGQIQPRKGVKDFIETAKKTPEASFVWIGGRPFGKLTEGYDDMTQLMKNPPENVEFIGEVEYKKVAEYYSMSDLFFMPSHQETFGLVITESASVGLPLLLRDIPIYKKLFAPYYHSADSVEGFSSAIQEIRNNKELRESRKEDAEKLAVKYDMESVAENLVRVYNELLKKS